MTMKGNAFMRKPEDEFINILTDDYTTFTPAETSEVPVEIDLGCGTGRFSTELGRLYPERRILAVDVMIGRLRKVVRKIKRAELANVRTLRVEARNLITYMLPDSSIERIHLLCPDPWPKARHRRHRLISSEFLGALSRVLRDEGVFHFSSDDDEYFDHVVGLTKLNERYRRADCMIEDVRLIETDFERRWIRQGKSVHHAAWKVSGSCELASVSRNAP